MEVAPNVTFTGLDLIEGIHRTSSEGVILVDYAPGSTSQKSINDRDRLHRILEPIKTFPAYTAIYNLSSARGIDQRKRRRGCLRLEC